MSIYLHFPFCLRKCRYCDFLSFPADDSVREAYIKRLCDEISFRKKTGTFTERPAITEAVIDTIFFGGGTPSIMSAEQLGAVMDTLHKEFNIAPDAEITIECNPKTADYGKLKAFRTMGINRLSIGLQSMNNKELETLGRIHTAEEFLQTYEDARKAGFDNINIDLMSALPGQTLAAYEDTVRKAAALSPEHISAYSLIIEPGTPFWDFYGEGKENDSISEAASLQNDMPCASKERILTNNYNRTSDILPLPDEDTEREMYYLTKTVLKDYGYERYEISNYARQGYECRHNLTYWRRGNYLGLGLGASSMIDNIRFKNTESLDKYMHDFTHEDIQKLQYEEMIEETIFLGLRCMSGISVKEFKSCFDKDIMDICSPNIDKYIKQGYMALENDHLKFTDPGIDISDWILADLLS